MKTYKFYSDAGHGWLAVKRKEVLDLGLIGKISSCSYQRGETVYLEEDCDMSIFVQTLRSRGFEFLLSSNKNPSLLFESQPLDMLVKVVEKYSERSPIRSYDSFSPRH